ncbi:MAG: 4Fe-4S dicluster domain-containing protein [Bacteroidales bacterium]
MISVIFLSIFLLLTVAASLAGVLSLAEKEKRAAGIFFALMLIFFLPPILSFAGLITSFTEILLLVVMTSTILLLFFPFSGTKHIKAGTPKSRIDERQTMFSRAELEPESKRYKTFYKDHPGLEETDRMWRKNPGLGSTNSRHYRPLAFASAQASFQVIANNRQFRHFSAETQAGKMDSESTGIYIRHWLSLLGAFDSGVCKTRGYHWYSQKGRGPDYGKDASLDHTHAIAFLLPMDKKMVDTAPHAPTMTESARQYAGSGTIALQLASFISRLGYEATAHIDGAYNMVLPLVAADAGLGTIGRMGILMHRRLGPRCRIAVVSTNMPLPVSRKQTDKSLLDFCRLCKKCALVCPSAAIPGSGRKEISGSLRWQINQESCYSYWTKAGTDCARCMAVCPYSHENNLLHRFIRFGIRNNLIFRKFAVTMDDVFYGKKPGRKASGIFDK